MIAINTGWPPESVLSCQRSYYSVDVRLLLNQDAGGSSLRFILELAKDFLEWLDPKYVMQTTYCSYYMARNVLCYKDAD
jgi:hypothetical protein